MKYEVGDLVTTNSDIFVTPRGTLLEIADHRTDGGYWAVIQEGMWIGLRQTFSEDDEVLPYSVPQESLDLTLQSATFVTKAGVKVGIKRSPCRHYYVKFEGQVQDRVSLAEVKKLMEGLK